MKLTERQLKSVSHITTSEVRMDLQSAKLELESYQNEYDVLSKNPQRNKLQLYILSGKISKGEKFVDELNQILEYRKNINQT